MVMHKKKEENPNDWEHVQFIQNEGERILKARDDEIGEVDSYL
jgi:hypothetical protein